jgi:GWxTD domain-containing protein
MRLLCPERKNSKKISLLRMAFCFLLSAYSVSAFSCRLYRLEQKLGPEDKEFLSKVRYIVTKEERKIFLELPEQGREEFKEEFWRRRDPYPDTEENEFKETYFQRIEEANQLFRGGFPGWLQDRGRIYILFGPPTQRSVYRMQASSTPREIWYYGNFPVIFVDETGTGDFRLVTLDVVHQLKMNQAEMAFQEKARPRDEFFDFDVQTRKTEEDEIIVTIEIDYRYIWFEGDKGRLETTIELSVEVMDTEGKVVFEDKSEYPVMILEEDIGKQRSLTIEFPLTLQSGEYRVNLEVVNRAGGEKRSKSLKIQF